MFIKKVNEYEGMTKEELKERLQIIDYEIASTRNKSKLKKFSKEAEMISKELRKIRKTEQSVPVRGGK